MGPRDLAEQRVVVVRRDRGEKVPMQLGEVAARLPGLLEEVQADLLAEATAERDRRTVDCSTLDEAVEAASDGFARLPWDVVRGDGIRALGEHSIAGRCLQAPGGALPGSDGGPGTLAIVARAYWARAPAAAALARLYSRRSGLPGGVGAAHAFC